MLQSLPLETLTISTRFRPSVETRKSPELLALVDVFDFFEIDVDTMSRTVISVIPSLHSLSIEVEEPPAVVWRAENAS